jgi:hypothetical protein
MFRWKFLQIMITKDAAKEFRATSYARTSKGNHFEQGSKLSTRLGIPILRLP